MKNHLDVIQKYAWKLVIDDATILPVHFSTQKSESSATYFSHLLQGRQGDFSVKNM